MKMHMDLWGQGHISFPPKPLQISVYTFPYTSYQTSITVILRRCKLNFCPKDNANLNTFEPLHNKRTEIEAMGHFVELATNISLSYKERHSAS